MNDERTYTLPKNVLNSQQADLRLRPTRDLAEYLQRYARERPEIVALCCFGIGFVLGWKLKPW